MNSEETQDSNALIENMLADISGIELEEGGNMQKDLVRLQNENSQLKADLIMKNKLLDLQKGTYDAQENQLRMHRSRMAAQDQKIKQLEAELKNLKSGGSSVKSGSSIDFEKQNSDIQKYLEEEKKKSREFSLKIDQLTSQLQSLKSQKNFHSQNSDNDLRELTSLKQLYEQKILELQETEKERKSLLRVVEDLKLKCQILQNQKKTDPVKEPFKQTKDTQTNTLKQKIKQLQKKINSITDQKQKQKKTTQKMLDKLKAQLCEANKVKDNIKFRLSQIQAQNQKLRSKAQIEGESQLNGFPSSISHESTINFAKKNKVAANIDDEKWNGPLEIKTLPVNEKIIKSLIQHFRIISHQYKIPFLNTISTWSQEQQQKLENSSYDLMGQMKFS